MKTISLPNIITDFIKATNNFDRSALMATFSEDALLNDQKRNFWGIAAIQKFIDREIIGDKVTMEVVKAIEHYGDYIVSAKMDETYDKTGLSDPLILDFYFSLRGEKITQLIILHNKAVE